VYATTQYADLQYSVLFKHHVVAMYTCKQILFTATSKVHPFLSWFSQNTWIPKIITCKPLIQIFTQMQQ